MTNTEHFMLMLLMVAVIIGIIFWLRFDKDKDFDKWFEALLKDAPHYGFNDLEIELFDEVEFYDYFAQGLQIDEALCEKLNNRTNLR